MDGNGSASNCIGFMSVECTCFITTLYFVLCIAAAANSANHSRFSLLDGFHPEASIPLQPPQQVYFLFPPPSSFFHLFSSLHFLIFSAFPLFGCLSLMGLGASYNRQSSLSILGYFKRKNVYGSELEKIACN